MQKASYLSITLGLLVLSASTGNARIVDDFSLGGWNLFSSTPGRISVGKGRLYLADGPDSPAWITASKTFSVDLDETPIFLVHVTNLSDRGTVKLIRKEPYDKRVAIEIDRPGLYAIDMHDTFGWQGRAAIQVCLYAIGEGEDITYSYVKFVGELTQEEENLIGNRAASGNVRLNVAPFEIVPLFHTCSFYFKSHELAGLTVEYRKRGGSWLRAYDPVYVREDLMYRGSIVDLEEDSLYELRIIGDQGEVLAQDSFQTWSSQVPIRKTITLDETNFQGKLNVRESGSPQGWIKITTNPDFVLRNDRTEPIIELDGVNHILLEGLTLRGGLKEAIRIKKCEYIRVINCDIAGWGRIGTQRFDLDGKYYTDDGRAINWDSAILVSRSLGTVVERCYIHDPVNRANSWYYSHPSGPQAVGMDKSPSTVLRYNDFIGSDPHRWNDAVEGAGNFHLDGGFHRDGDIYGNFICFANDDALEIDGGQTNVRVFHNKFEGCLCAVSIQGCMSGPSYVFKNLLVNMGDDRGLAGQTIKTSSHANGPSAVSFIFNNTCYGGGRDLSLRHNLRIVARNNIFAGRSAIGGREGSPQSDCDYNLLSTGQPGDEPHGIIGRPEFVDSASALFHLRPTSPGVGEGIAIENFMPIDNTPPDMGAIPYGSGRVLPQRPIPIILDRYQVNFSAAELISANTRIVSASVKEERFSFPYRIAKNETFSWFEVSPQSGVLTSDQSTEFTVTIRPEKMTQRAIYRGAFLIRLDNGFSLPVTVYAETDFIPEIKPTREDTWVTYIEADSPRDRVYPSFRDPSATEGKCLQLSGPAKTNPVTYRFSVPDKGIYFILLRIKSNKPVSEHDSIYFSVNDGPLDRAQLRSDSTWTWSLAAHNRSMSLICLQAFDLNAGDHTLKLAPRESLYVDLIAITDHPGMFE